MTHKPRIAVIIGTTRDSRFGDKPAQLNWWTRATMAARTEARARAA